MKKPMKFAALGLGALALFATTYFTIFAVMGVPMAEVPGADRVFGKDAGTVSPTRPVISKPAPKPDPVRESVERASDVLGAFVLPAGVQAETLRTLKTELFDQLELVRKTREELALRDQELTDRESELNGRFDALMALRGRLDEYHLELEARAEELSHEQSVRDQDRAQRLTEMSRYLAEGDAINAASLLSGMDPSDAARVLDALEPERAGEILRSMTPEASSRVWEAGLAQSK